MSATIDIGRWLAEHPTLNPDDGFIGEPERTPLRREAFAVRALDAPSAQPPQWRVRSLLPDRDFALIVGEDGVCKSTVALHIAAAVAGGYRVFDSFYSEAGPVLIISEEDDSGTIMIRLEAIVAGHGWNRERVLGNTHFMALEGANLGERDWQVRLRAEVDRTHAALLVLDPLAELIDGDENDNSAVRPILKWIRSLPCATVLVHHFGKNVEGRSDGDRIRGASAWRRGARVILALEGVHEDRVRVKQLKLTKARRQPPFVLKRHIVADVENEAHWQRATLIFETDRRGRSEGAREWVLARLDESDEGLLSTALREAAIGSGFSGEDVARAIRSLESEGAIEANRLPDDSRNAKRWRRRVPF